MLQLRLHPALAAFREELRKDPATRHRVRLSYLTARGRWYDVSWKGVEERSGGIGTNIGIHFFDLLLWLFGGVKESAVHLRKGSGPAAPWCWRMPSVDGTLSGSGGPAVQTAAGIEDDVPRHHG